MTFHTKVADMAAGPERPGCTRAEMLSMAAGVGAAGALLTGGALVPTAALAHESASSQGDAASQGTSGFNPYAGVEERSVGAEGSASSSSSSDSADYVAPYATPHVTYADERVSDVRRVLVVVDYQVDFVDGGVFGRIEPAVAIEDALCAKIEEYRESGDVIIYTMDTHPADEYEDTREASVNPLHCDPATEGWQLYGRVRELLTPQNAILIKKGTYGSPELVRTIERLRDQGMCIESVEFAGVSTTCRVLHNAIMVYNAFPELPMIMDEATTASYTDERTAEQLEELEAWGFVVKRRNY